MSEVRAIPRVMLACQELNVAGGVERFVCTLANHLVRKGMAVTIATVSTMRSEVHYPLLKEVQVLSGLSASVGRETEAPARETAWRILVTQWRTGRTLGRLARQEWPDVLLLNGLTTACSVLLASPGLAARSVCCDHNHFNARSRPWRYLRAWLYPKVAAVVSLTHGDAPSFRALNANTRVIANASALNAEVPSMLSTPIVLAVGRLVAQKGFDLLLKAWPQVVAAVPAARLRIVGDGPLRRALKAQADSAGIDSSVEWFPVAESMEREYREAAVFVLPSRYEGMPLSLLEAQALGVPAVAFDCPTGPREIVSADTGIIVPLGDVQGLATALAGLLQEPKRRFRMGLAAIERQRREFSAARHFDSWTALLCEIAGTREQVSAVAR